MSGYVLDTPGHRQTPDFATPMLPRHITRGCVAMPNNTLLDDKNLVRAELMRLARAGQITYYGGLGAAVGKHARWPLWTDVLDGISTDELAKHNPDITDLVLNAKTGWPSRISRKFTHGKPTPQQKQKAQSGLDAVFSHYCPGKPAPKLPKPKR